MKSLRHNTPYLFSAIILIVLVWFDFNIDRSLKIETNFTKDTPRISEFTPPGLVEQNLIKGERVFFKVHLPSIYNRGELNFQLSNVEDREVIVGLVEPSGINQRQVVNGPVVFNLPKSTELKFALLSTGVSLEKPLMVNELRAGFYRDKFGLIDYIKIWIQRLNSIL